MRHVLILLILLLPIAGKACVEFHLESLSVPIDDSEASELETVNTVLPISREDILGVRVITDMMTPEFQVEPDGTVGGMIEMLSSPIVGFTESYALELGLSEKAVYYLSIATSSLETPQISIRREGTEVFSVILSDIGNGRQIWLPFDNYEAAKVAATMLTKLCEPEE